MNTSVLQQIRTSTDAEIRGMLERIADEQPDEVLVVFLKAGQVFTRSNGTFSKMRTLGALELLKHDILGG